MIHIYKFAAIFLLVIAVIQWFGIGEKTYHALWQWYKFKDFNGDSRGFISNKKPGWKFRKFNR